MRWYQKVADAGDADAMRRIGVLYEGGHGVEQDYVEAMRWYQKAAKRGDADAMTNIGFLHGGGPRRQTGPRFEADALVSEGGGAGGGRRGRDDRHRRRVP